ncbi:MAG TPA: hypothetical protein VFU31_10780 [Candidatus Binatia bacterium]|nr:hypothetical protein [Candidatus Binatia bacterium]
MSAVPNQDIKVADEVWIAAALLHKENSNRTEFTVAEIVERARRENISGRMRSGVQVHAYLHCVANRPPNPGRYRILYATGKNTRRLFREGDDFHPERRSGKVAPDRDNIPAKYRPLLDWYNEKYVGRKKPGMESDPILGLRGLGKQLWAGEEPDEYVSRVRGSWE